MKNTMAYSTDSTRRAVAAAVPFFRSRWGLLTLLAVGSGLYLYQRRGGSVRALASRAWDMGVKARNSIGSVAPSVSASSESIGDFGTSSSDMSYSSRQSSPSAGI